MTFMKKIFLFPILFCQFLTHAQVTAYKKTTAMIPMRDGIKLFTVIYSPINTGDKFPFMIERTPYGAFNRSDTFDFSPIPGYAAMARDGYIFVFQDIRGKFKSEGTMEMNRPMYHQKNPSAIDESTDTYDTVDWLVKNVANNNGKAGIRGVSYDGWLAMVASVDPHPALKAASEQATPADMFLGDDFHHNGAFRLSYGFEYSYLFEHEKETSSFPFPQFDLYDWYLKLGSLKNVNEKYFHRELPTWNEFTQHPNYDTFWQKRSAMGYVPYPQTAMLHVGGYFDQEDMNGPQVMYRHMEKKDSFKRNYIVLGPWRHGQWFNGKGDSLGKISFEVKTGEYFRDLQKKWFDFWLKGIGDGKFDEAYCFQTGSNLWKSYSAWPPREATINKLYVAPNNKCSFDKPTSTGYTSYISDPAHPVPYRMPPIEATYGRGSHWYFWQVEDQRFVSSRPDVISFTSDSLTADLAVTGKIVAHLFASTSGTDADWVVKLIDVYPNSDQKNLLMSQYQLPVAMEVFRGRFRKSFSNPQPLTPNKAEEFVIDLHDVNHVFKKGHQLMIQVQSTWFPVIDRNPQKYVPNIFEAKESDFQKAEQRVYYSTYIELPVMKE
jgi:putative CocE/NonD family hydrolase